MVKINKVYTKKGDKGTTCILGPQRIPKSSEQIILLGALDEFNAYIGWILVQINDEQLQQRLIAIQNQLFDLGAFVCKPTSDLPPTLTQAVAIFETEIDKMNEQLPSLNSFVLPGGGELAARFHIARTVCRRAETQLVIASNNQAIATAIPYLNRLSDWLFVAARYCNKEENVPELLWNIPPSAAGG